MGCMEDARRAAFNASEKELGKATVKGAADREARFKDITEEIAGTGTCCICQCSNLSYPKEHEHIRADHLKKKTFKWGNREREITICYMCDTSLCQHYIEPFKEKEFYPFHEKRREFMAKVEELKKIF